MVSNQDSIENCSICQNSRKKHYFLAPNNYQHIFGYLGPASKTNIHLLNSAKKQHSSKTNLKQSTSRLSKLFYAKNLDLRRDKSQKWIPPNMFLYNFKSTDICDDSKMRYDESDTDFDDLKYRKKPTKTRSKKKTSIAKSKKNERHRDDSCCSNNTSSIDSLVKYKVKKKSRKLEPEEDHHVHSRAHEHAHITKAATKKKIPYFDHSTFSIDSTKRMKKKSSIKMKNMKTVLMDLFGSMVSVKPKHKRRNYLKYEDSEDIKERKTKKEPSYKVKAKKIQRKRSTSSTDTSTKEKTTNYSIESVNVKGYRRKKRDKEDEKNELVKKKNKMSSKCSICVNQKVCINKKHKYSNGKW